MARMRRAFAVAAIFVAGCASGLPGGTQPATTHPAWYRQAPDAIRKGVYIDEFYTNAILAYAGTKPNKNLPPVCSLPASYVVDVATDASGNLIDPDGGSHTVTVYRGPAVCGAKLGSFADPDGQPSDAATLDAADDTIYVGNIQATRESSGDVSVCTLAGGCSAVLSNPAIGGELFGVAEDKRGNVYATGYASSTGGRGSGSGASLVHWKGGKGKGSVIAAYRNAWPGGLDFDRDGNLLALDTFAQNTGALWVYSGCPAHCVAHGPFALQGESVYGKVDATARLFEAADFEHGQVDVYRYHGTRGITYLYSFSDGLSPSGVVEGIAIEPASGS
jgi:hypothetical protein